MEAAWKQGPNFPHLSNCIVCLCLVAQLCLTICDPVDCSLPGSSVRGIFQARILEYVAVSSSRNLPTGIEPASPVSPALQGDSLSTEASRECVAKVHGPYSFAGFSQSVQSLSHV